jgi:hypothetical protein
MQAATTAPGITFELVPTDRRAAEQLERGSGFVPDDQLSHAGGHPRRPMYRTKHAVIRWSGADYGRELTAEAFLALPTTPVAYFGADRHPAFTETYFSQQGIARKIDVRVPEFLSPASAVISPAPGNRYRRHAEVLRQVSAAYGSRSAVFLPTVTEEAQWHTLRHADEGLKWLLELFTTRAPLESGSDG